MPMTSTWRRIMIYLGLAGDEEYEYLDASGEGGPSRVSGESGRASGSTTRTRSQRPEGAARSADGASVQQAGASARAERAGERADGATTPSGRAREREGEVAGPRPGAVQGSPAVRPVRPASTAKPHVVTPVSFDDAQQVADRFKAHQPVIMNLQEVPRDLARRLIDFASGLCYGLGGAMEKVASHVYLLTPANVQVSEEDRRKIRERGLASV